MQPSPKLTPNQRILEQVKQQNAARRAANTATLHGAQVMPAIAGSSFSLRGHIYGDPHERWEDGTLIYTSRVVAMHDSGAPIFVTVSGNLYAIASWRAA